MGKLS